MPSPEHAEVFNWDDDDDERGNTSHLAESRQGRPSITASEVEEVFFNGGVFVPNKRQGSGDWKMIGRTDSGRLLTVVVHYDHDRRMLRAITGWNTTAGEQARHL